MLYHCSFVLLLNASIQLQVRQAGVTVQRIVPGLQSRCSQLDQYFNIQHPQVTFNICSIRKFINSHFVLRTRRDRMPMAWRERPMLELRGENSIKGDDLMYVSHVGFRLFPSVFVLVHFLFSSLVNYHSLVSTCIC